MSSIPISAPHAHDQSSTDRIMLYVCLALLPCTLFGFYLFGYAAINLFVMTVFSAVAWESLCLMLRGQRQHTLADGSALLTGWLLALTLPPWAPWWIGVGGSFVAIVVGKQLYGGLGQNVFNPAMLARVALLVSFPVQMTTWPLVLDSFSQVSFNDALAITAGWQSIPDGYTGATSLGALKTGLSTGQPAAVLIAENDHYDSMFFGIGNGSMGETSALLILLGGLWLLAKRIISWHIPVAMLTTTVLISLIFYGFDADRYGDPVFHLFSGGLMLGAFFIATDLVTSPSSKSGQLVFGAGCGLFDFVIRTWGGFPEGVGFAVLFMNALTPLIDLHFRPRIYGRNNDGSALSANPGRSAP